MIQATPWYAASGVDLDGEELLSKPWSKSTKRLVVIGIVLVLAVAVVRFGRALAPLAVAVIIAYLLNRPVNWIARRTRMPRKPIAVATYLVFFMVLVLIPALLAPLLIHQVLRIVLDLWAINEQTQALTETLATYNLSIDLNDLTLQMTQALVKMLPSLASDAIGVLFGIAEGVIWVIFIFVVGLYLLLDADRFGDWFDHLAPPDYRREVTLLRREIGAIWSAFLVGQLILCAVMGLCVGGAMVVLGIRSAIILGLVAALAELAPNIGHHISTIVGITVALVEGSYLLPISNPGVAVIVALIYIAIAQLDINFFIPRIIGRRMHLPPAVIIIGLIAGASVGGVLGLILAAPTLASLRVLGSYVHRRLLDMQPYVLVNGERPLRVVVETDLEAKTLASPDTLLSHETA